jgi:hypothetical protein
MGSLKTIHTTFAGQKNVPSFVEPEGSSPCSKQPATGRYPQMHPIHTLHPYHPKFHFSITLPSTLLVAVKRNLSKDNKVT